MCPPFSEHLPPPMIGMVIELRDFKEKKQNNNMDKMGKIFLALIGRESRIFHTQFCFDMFYAVKAPKVELT